jgi:hypothetical protein
MNGAGTLFIKGPTPVAKDLEDAFRREVFALLKREGLINDFIVDKSFQLFLLWGSPIYCGCQNWRIAEGLGCYWIPHNGASVNGCGLYQASCFNAAPEPRRGWRRNKQEAPTAPAQGGCWAIILITCQYFKIIPPRQGHQLI